MQNWNAWNFNLVNGLGNNKCKYERGTKLVICIKGGEAKQIRNFDCDITLTYIMHFYH